MANNRWSRGVMAFSLVELMTAVALLAIIMVALMMAFQQAQRAFRMGANQVDVLENGRAMMGLFSRDLQEMTFSGLPGPYYNLYANLTPGSTNTQLTLPNGTMDVFLEDLFFLTRFNDDCATIRYALVEDAPRIGVATLYRKTNAAPWMDVGLVASNVLATESPLIGTNLNPNFHRVAEGVVHFRVQAFDKFGNPMAPTNAPGEIVIIPIGAVPPYMSYGFSNTNLPAFVDLELGILEPQSYKYFQARLQASPAAASAFLKEKQRAGRIHLFRQRIPIRIQSRIET